MRTRAEAIFGAGTPRWRQAGLAVVFGLSLALGMSVHTRDAAAAARDCVPAEPPMGTARDALKDSNREGGLRSQEGAIDELQKCLVQKERERKQALDELNNVLNNMQMARPGQGDDGDDDMMSALDELGNMIREQQKLRDKTFQQGQDQRRQQRGQRGQQGQQGQQGDPKRFGDLQQNQQALRDRLNKLMEQLKQKGLGQQKGDGQGDQQGQQGDQLGEAGEAMGDAEGSLGEGNADGAVDSQGRALDAMRKGAQSLAQQLQQQMGQGQGPGQPGGPGRQRAQQDTDPLGRPLRGRDYDDSTVKVPMEADVQRARRILEELRRRYGESMRPQLELDYIERLLKDY
jgi:uncharacterized protein (TIGR02302 family)